MTAITNNFGQHSFKKGIKRESWNIFVFEINKLCFSQEKIDNE